VEAAGGTQTSMWIRLRCGRGASICWNQNDAAKIVGAGGSQVEITSAGGGQHGDYTLRVVPVTYQGTQYTWAYGRYVFFLAVAHGVDQGQTVCAVFVH
jgi:hypothetical protein